jgi:protease-4
MTAWGKQYLTENSGWHIIAKRSIFSMEDEHRRRMKEEVKRRSIDVIVRAVATGIFILSIFLNVIFLILIIFLSSLLGSEKYRDVAKIGYRKVYQEDGFPSSKAPRDEIALIHLTGMITEASPGSVFDYAEDPVSAVKNRLKAVKRDEKIRGVLLVIDTPGGSTSASDLLYREVMQFKKDTGLPVVTMMRQIAASGGYYVAVATDYIVAEPTTLTGSIGVIMFHFNVKNLMEKFGVEYIAIKTGKHKDILSPFKEIETEELAWMQDIVEQMLDQFIDAVATGRKNLSRERILEFTDGRIYIAKDALELGLIDEIGYLDTAVSVLAQRAGVSEPNVVEFERERSIRQLLSLMRVQMKHRSVLELLCERRFRDAELLRAGEYSSWNFHPEDYSPGDFSPIKIFYLWDGVIGMHR